MTSQVPEDELRILIVYLIFSYFCKSSLVGYAILISSISGSDRWRCSAIVKGEFVEMFKLLWTNQGGEGDANKQAKRSHSNKKVQDINVWLQWYALYVGVKALKAPNLIPELMAYQISILRASQEYEGTVWATYDAARWLLRDTQSGPRSIRHCMDYVSWGKPR